MSINILKKIIFLLFFLSTLVTSNSFGQDEKDENYAFIFGVEYTEAVNFCKTFKDIIKASAKKYDIPPAELSAIIFPELIRYSQVSNLIETTALEYSYVNYGTEYVDFSIGRFQMKPSFIEGLEKKLKIQETWTCDFSHLLEYTSKEITAQRKERLERMNNVIWQIEYLCCFYKMIESKFINSIYWKPQSRVRFLATAYNHGYQKKDTEIMKYATKRFFPNGANYPADYQYAYANVAYDFYTKHALKLFDDSL
ncbi:MAG: hypothetical protein MK212_18155 [Saprospiraceae bacterium]|nr:hypothetical protein [Saprospiraceae bacterium]